MKKEQDSPSNEEKDAAKNDINLKCNYPKFSKLSTSRYLHNRKKLNEIKKNKNKESNKDSPNLYVTPICDISSLRDRFKSNARISRLENGVRFRDGEIRYIKSPKDENVGSRKKQFYINLGGSSSCNPMGGHIEKISENKICDNWDQPRSIANELGVSFILIKRFLVVEYPHQCKINSPMLFTIQFLLDNSPISVDSRLMKVEFIAPYSDFITLTIIATAPHSDIDHKWKIIKVPLYQNSEKINFFIYPKNEKNGFIQMDIFHDAGRIISNIFEFDVIKAIDEVEI